HYRAFLRFRFSAKEIHECGLAGAVRAGQAVAPPGQEGGRDVFEQYFGAEAHADIADGNHGLVVNFWNGIRHHYSKTARRGVRTRAASRLLSTPAVRMANLSAQDHASRRVSTGTHDTPHWQLTIEI